MTSSDLNRLRSGLALACLAGVVFFEVSAFQFREFGPRLRFLAKNCAWQPERTRPAGSALAFDRGYGLFLEGVRQATPPGGTVAVAAPLDRPKYRDATFYILAPRRVVPASAAGQAEYLAVYRGSLPAGVRPIAFVRFGVVGKLR